MIGSRSQFESPLGRLRADVLLPILDNDAVANVLQIHLLPIELCWTALQILLHIIEQLRDVQLMSRERDRVPVAESEIDGRSLAGGLRRRRFEAAPVLDDLIERQLSMRVRPNSVVGDRCLPRLNRFRVLPPVLVEVRDQIASLLAFAALAAGDDRLPDAVRIEFVRQLEAFHAGREVGDRLVLAERVDGERSGLRFAIVLRVVHESRPPAEVSHRLDAELALQKRRVSQQHFILPSGVQFDGL